MTRIIDYQVQVAETVTLFALEESETEQRWGAWGDTRGRSKPFGGRHRELQHASGFVRLSDQSRMLLAGQQKKNTDGEHCITPPARLFYPTERAAHLTGRS